MYGPPTAKRFKRRGRRLSSAAVLACVTVSLLVAPSAANALFDDDFEGYRTSTSFDSATGIPGSVVSASGEYVGYVAGYNSVEIKHYTGPGDTDWESVKLTPPPAMEGTFAKRVVVDALSGRAFVTPYPKTYIKEGGAQETTAEVFVYLLSGENTWTYDKTLTVDVPVGTANRAIFGYSIEVSGDVIAVSAESARRESNSGNGAVYLINVVTGDWQRVEHSDSRGQDEFGTFIGFNGTKLAVSSPNPLSTCDRYNVGASTNCRLGKVTLFDVDNVQASNPRIIENPQDPKTYHPAGISTRPFGTTLKFADGKLFVASPEEMNFASDNALDPVEGLVTSAFTSGTTTQGAIYVFDDETAQQLGGKIIPPQHHYNSAENFDVNDEQLVSTSLSRDDGQYEQGELLVYNLADINFVSGDALKRQQPAPQFELRPGGLQDGDRFAYQTGNIAMANNRIFVPSPQIDDGQLFVLDAVRKRSTILPAVTTTYGQGGTVATTVDAQGKDGGVSRLSIDGTLFGEQNVSGYAAEFVLPSGADSYTAGVHEMAVSYDGLFGSSPALAQQTLTVEKASTAINVSTLELEQLATNPSASIAVAGTVVAAYGTVPTGRVVVMVNGEAQAEADLDSSGAFSADLSGLTGTQFSVELRYVGDANHLESVSDSRELGKAAPPSTEPTVPPSTEPTVPPTDEPTARPTDDATTAAPDSTLPPEDGSGTSDGGLSVTGANDGGLLGFAWITVLVGAALLGGALRRKDRLDA